MAVNPPLRREKDYVLQSLKLIVPRLGKEFDITSHFALLTYEEDIFSGTIHGSILMQDSVDYPTLIPMIGEEKIKFVLTRQDEKKPDSGDVLPPLEFEGWIYSLTDREIQTPSNKLQAYTMYFTSEGLVNNFRRKVTKTWKGKLNSEIVQQVYDDYLSTGKPINVEETKYLQDYVATNKKPMKIIRDITCRSVSADGDGALYVFYEDRESFHFVTLDTLLEKEPSKVIKKQIRNISDDGRQQFDKFIDTVTDYHNASSFDFFNSIDSGHQSSRLLLVDPIRRKFEYKDFNLDAEWDSFKHTDAAKTFTSDESSNRQLNVPAARISMIISDKDQDVTAHLIEKDPDIKPFKLDEILLKRDSQLQQVKKYIISASLPGDPRIKAGDTIEFKIPEILGKTSEEFPEEMDKFISGKYLIVSCAHILQNVHYTVNVELIKDSFLNEIFHRDPIEEYKPIY